MKKKTVIRFVGGLMGILFILLQSASCGGGGGSGGGGAGGAGGCGTPASLEGRWLFQLTLTEVWGDDGDDWDCIGDSVGETEEDEVLVLQDGNTIQVINSDGDTLDGSVCGNSVSVHFELGGAGVHYEEDYDLEFHPDGDLGYMSGTGTASFTDGSATCSWTFDVLAVRIETVSVDEDLGFVTVINDERDTEALVFMRPKNQGHRGLATLGTVPPGTAVVFPLPPGSWQVFIAYPGEDAHRLNLSVASVFPNSRDFNSVNAGPGSKSGFLFGFK